MAEFFVSLEMGFDFGFLRGNFLFVGLIVFSSFWNLAEKIFRLRWLLAHICMVFTHRFEEEAVA
jgi:hypothetical protein